MYVGVDVGGTKTLLAVLNNEGIIKERKKFPTPKSYDHWLLELKHAAHHLEHKDFKAGGAGMPFVVYNRELGRAKNYGNLPWKNTPVQADLEKLFHCPFVVENDAKMAGLSEAMLLKVRYDKVVYVTISTGVGYALIVNKKIDTNIGDGGGRLLTVEHRGRHVPLDDFASGRAIVERYGKRAEDIHDQATWRKICRDLATGLLPIIAMTEPDVVVIGGSVGSYFDRYGDILKEELKKYHLPLIKLPDLRQAQRPEEAVVFGCYDLARQRFSHG